jgi:hypothetical protein
MNVSCEKKRKPKPTKQIWGGKKKQATHVQACAEAINHMDVTVNRRWITQTIKAEVSHEGSLVVGSWPVSVTGLQWAYYTSKPTASSNILKTYEVWQLNNQTDSVTKFQWALTSSKYYIFWFYTSIPASLPCLETILEMILWKSFQKDIFNSLNTEVSRRINSGEYG